MKKYSKWLDVIAWLLILLFLTLVCLLAVGPVDARPLDPNMPPRPRVSATKVILPNDVIPDMLMPPPLTPTKVIMPNNVFSDPLQLRATSTATYPPTVTRTATYPPLPTRTRTPTPTWTVGCKTRTH